MQEKEHPKRLLIVDDETVVAMVLAESLERMFKGYSIDIANDAREALNHLENHSYVLMITDYRMPGMNGIDLAVAARRLAPDMPTVLMTAYGTEQLRATMAEIGLADFIAKPFSVAQIREIVERAVKHTEGTEDPFRSGFHTFDQPVKEHLKSLQADIGARCIMLVSASGFPVETSGQTSGIDVISVGALVAANFMAAAELARLLGKGSVFKSSYHEGQGSTDYNLYAYDVNGDLLLVVVFGSESKTGAVWFYTRQTAEALRPLLGDDLIVSVPRSAGLPLKTEHNFIGELSKELDGLFNSSGDIG